MLTKTRVLDRLLSNPWAQPPLPSDWEVQPTYRKRSVPYYLAPLWDAQVAARESAEATKRKNQSKGSAATGGDGKVPKELREKLKKTKAAKGLLQDLEEQVRNFVKQWEAKNRKAPPAPKPDLESDEEEIVFVGRNGQMHDVPQSPHAVVDDFDEDDIKRDKLVFDSLADDHGASFGYAMLIVVADGSLLICIQVAGSSTRSLRTMIFIHGPLLLGTLRGEKHMLG